MGVKELRVSSRDVNNFKVEDTYEQDGFNLRDDDEATRAHIAELVQSIDEVGHIIVPLVGVFDAPSGKVRVIEGHCRRLAAMEVNKSRDADTQVLLPIISPQSKVALSDAELTCMILSSNSGQRLSALEQAKGVRRLHDMGMEPSIIARKVVPSQTVQWVMHLLNGSAATPETKEAIKAGDVSFTAVAREIAATTPEVAAETVKAAVTAAKSKGAKKATQRDVEAHRPATARKANGKPAKMTASKAAAKSDEADKATALFALMRQAWPEWKVTHNGESVVTMSRADWEQVNSLLETA